MGRADSRDQWLTSRSSCRPRIDPGRTGARIASTSRLFEVENNKLTLSSSDLESTMTSEIDIESTSNDKIAISAKLLTDILKTFFIKKVF